MRLALLGSTGSIGRNTLEVCREMRQAGAEVEVVVLTAGANMELLAEQIAEFEPIAVAVGDDVARLNLVQIWSDTRSGKRLPQIAAGLGANRQAVESTDFDVLVSAAVGVVGLEATYEAVRRGKRIALANKETIVAAGELIVAEAARSGAELLPVDSEHNGVHQCLRSGRRSEVRRLILTASGGPFRQTPLEELEGVTPQQALDHPTWKMGARITIDSATLMNKGFEVIEACRLFGFPPAQVEVTIHPQSIVHALVEYCDGSLIAQLGSPDMKTPIRYALTYPERQPAPQRRLSWGEALRLDFEPPDYQKFPLLRLAYEAAETGGTAGCVLNAADEVAVDAFLRSEIPFLTIPQVVEKTFEEVGAPRAETLAAVRDVDAEARRVARSLLAERKVRVEV